MAGDIKPCINKLTRLLDAKGVHWTIRIGKAIGRETPAGELRNFLGDQVIQALWGWQPDARK